MARSEATWPSTVVTAIPAELATCGGVDGFAALEMAVLPAAHEPSAFAVKSDLLGPPSPHATRAAASATEGMSTDFRVRT